ncbi:MAG TPA: hypothetical protein VJB15_07230, partial [Rhodothermia bacterium]|nr:hypothetical protein [Rhodothermia bacterium]
FSGRWMSELDNTRSLAELGEIVVRYTRPETYLPVLIADYEKRWRPNGSVPLGYEQRPKEIEFVTASIARGGVANRSQTG